MKIKLAIILVGCLTVGTEGCGFFIPATYNAEEYRPIHQAALDGNMVKLIELVEANPDHVNLRDYDQNTPLHLASIHDRAEAVNFLLNNGATVDAQNSFSMTPLQLAAKQGFITIVRLLVCNNANLDMKDSRGWTALIWAERAHHEDIAKLLRNKEDCTTRSSRQRGLVREQLATH
jgi:ankyrin repeat protein